MNLNEECLLKYLQNPDDLFNLTAILADFNAVIDSSINVENILIP